MAVISSPPSERQGKASHLHPSIKINLHNISGKKKMEEVKKNEREEEKWKKRRKEQGKPEGEEKYSLSLSSLCTFLSQGTAQPQSASGKA